MGEGTEEAWAWQPYPIGRDGEVVRRGCAPVHGAVGGIGRGEGGDKGERGSGPARMGGPTVG